MPSLEDLVEMGGDGPRGQEQAGGDLLVGVAVLDGTAQVIGYLTVVEAHLLAGLAHRDLGDQRAANQAAERALALAEPDRPVLPFLMTDARELLEGLPRHETAHAALRLLMIFNGGGYGHSRVPAAAPAPATPPVTRPGPQ